jgi:hypothetical protein
LRKKLLQEQVLRYAQDFGSGLRRPLNASSLERSDRSAGNSQASPAGAASLLKRELENLPVYDALERFGAQRQKLKIE